MGVGLKTVIDSLLQSMENRKKTNPLTLDSRYNFHMLAPLSQNVFTVLK